jgi:hypothetical protein
MGCPHEESAFQLVKIIRSVRCHVTSYAIIDSLQCVNDQAVCYASPAIGGNRAESGITCKGKGIAEIGPRVTISTVQASE